MWKPKKYFWKILFYVQKVAELNSDPVLYGNTSFFSMGDIFTTLFYPGFYISIGRKNIFEVVKVQRSPLGLLDRFCGSKRQFYKIFLEIFLKIFYFKHQLANIVKVKIESF